MAALLTVVGLGFLLLCSAPSALAHAGVTGSNPLEGEMLTTAPQHVDVEFSERLINAGAALVVTGPDGSIVSEAKPTIQGRTMSTRISGELGPGEYSVAYRVVSEDGHAVKGTYAFFIENGTPVPQPNESEAAQSQPPQSPNSQPQPTEPQPSASVIAAPTDSDSSGSPWVLIAIGAVAAVAIVVGIAFVRRRST